LTALVFAAVSCDNPNPDSGILLEAGGGITVLYRPCDKASKVLIVRLENRGIVLWQISALTPSAARSFAVGRENEGFRTDIALESPFDGKRLRLVISSSTHPGKEEYFDLSDLKEGSVFVPRRGLSSESDFWQLNTCEGAGLLGRCR
jgi:hypothetical protein